MSEQRVIDVVYREPESCEGCQWYHEWFGVCCSGESEQRGDVSYRCDKYVAGDPLPGVKDRNDVD